MCHRAIRLDFNKRLLLHVRLLRYIGILRHYRLIVGHENISCYYIFATFLILAFIFRKIIFSHLFWLDSHLFAGPILNRINLSASFYQTCTYTTQIYMSN